MSDEYLETHEAWIRAVRVMRKGGVGVKEHSMGKGR